VASTNDELILVRADHQNSKPVHSAERVRGARSDQLHSQDSGATVDDQGTVAVAAVGHEAFVRRQLSVHCVTSQSGQHRGSRRVGSWVSEKALRQQRALSGLSASLKIAEIYSL